MRFTLRLLHQFLSFQKFINATVALAGMIEVRDICHYRGWSHCHQSSRSRGVQPDERALVATAANGNVYVVKEILAANKLNDIAILRLELPDGEKLTPAKIADRAIPGEDVYAISHPVSRFYTLTKGVVSRNAMMHTPNGSAKRLYITAEFAKGSSGSPIFNSRGEVVGIVSSTQSIYYTQTSRSRRTYKWYFEIVFRLPRCIYY